MIQFTPDSQESQNDQAYALALAAYTLYNLNDSDAFISFLLKHPDFIPYRQVFSSLGIGSRTQALLLTRIFPLSKQTSVASFKQRLGVGRVEESSGDSERSVQSGSSLCRVALYLWILDTYTIGKKRRRPMNVGV
jgi:hypothetical protein